MCITHLHVYNIPRLVHGHDINFIHRSETRRKRKPLTLCAPYSRAQHIESCAHDIICSDAKKTHTHIYVHHTSACIPHIACCAHATMQLHMNKRKHHTHVHHLRVHNIHIKCCTQDTLRSDTHENNNTAHTCIHHLRVHTTSRIVHMTLCTATRKKTKPHTCMHHLCVHTISHVVHMAWCSDMFKEKTWHICTLSAFTQHIGLCTSHHAVARVKDAVQKSNTHTHTIYQKENTRCII